MGIDLRVLRSAARRIKHCGDYGRLFVQSGTGKVHWTAGDGDDTAEISTILKVPGVTHVEIGDEWSPSEQEGWKRIEFNESSPVDVIVHHLLNESPFGYRPEPKKRVRRPPEKRGTPPTDPHARAAYDAGGTLIHAPLPSREKWNRELARYAPGCGSPIHVPGTNGGTMPCGADFNGKPFFCDHCDPNKVVEALIEDEDKSWIAVDFDGTLATHTTYKGPTKLGDPVEKMMARVRRWIKNGKRIKIFTARADDEKSVNAIKQWLKDNDLPDLEITNLKDRDMTELWDDKAIGIVKNKGEIKEAMDITPETMNWFQNLLRTMKPKGIWGVPATGQVYEIDQPNRTVTLVQGDPNDEKHWHETTKKIFELLGYTVHDAPDSPDEQAFAESADQIVDAMLARERKPVVARIGDNEEEEIDNAARQPFTAYDHALRTGKHHPKLWNAIKGTPYARQYLQRFPVDEAKFRVSPKEMDRALDFLRRRNPVGYAQFIAAPYSPIPAYAWDDPNGEWWSSSDARNVLQTIRDSAQEGVKPGKPLHHYRPARYSYEAEEDEANWKDLQLPPLKRGTLVTCNNEHDENYGKHGTIKEWLGGEDDFYSVQFPTNSMPYSRDELDVIHNAPESLESLVESPEIATLKKSARPLDPEERAQVMKAGAVWHHGPSGQATPAVRKAIVKGKTWYWCATHRAGRVKPTLKGAIKAFDFVKTTS
jgi:hypothetical protein